jgi:hypothetical protein
MHAAFQDLQDRHNPVNGMRVSDARGLDALLESCRDREPFFFELVGYDGCAVLVGFAAHSGRVQYSATDGDGDSRGRFPRCRHAR